MPVVYTILTLLLLVGLSAAFLYRYALPKTEGELKIEGLTEPVMVRRDTFGYVRIEATSIPDAVFAQGFVHAQDRLWQMDVNRRVGDGRLAELFGEAALPADRYLRRLGLRRAAQVDFDALDDKERSLLMSYCAGVNAGRRSIGWRLPWEFRLLKVSFQPWTPLDSLTWIQVMSMDLCANWDQELLRGKMLEKLGAPGAALVQLLTRSGAVSVPAPHGEDVEPLFGNLQELYEQAKSFLPNGGLPGASNAWAVSGERSESGRPLLAGDPHLMGRVPGIWHEVHLVAPNLNVCGAGFPGFPLVVIGHNEKVAWGITNSYADTQDLYIERFHPEDALQVEVPGGGYAPLEVIRELIPVKGMDSVLEEVLVSRHGPLLIRTEQLGLALRWVNYDASHPISTILAMNQAGGCAEFKEALRHWQAPSSSFVFADVAGNISYLMAGDIPIRKKGTGLTPVPGWTDEYEWVSRIPFEELPCVENPACGFVVTANNPVVDSGYPHHLTWDFLGSARADRIEELLKERQLHTMDDFQRMQVDFHSLMGVRFVRTLAQVEAPGRAEEKVLNILRQWDGQGTEQSAGMAVYQVMLLTTLKAILEPVMGDELFAEMLGAPTDPLAVMAGHTGRYTTWLVEFLEDPSDFALLETNESLSELLVESLSRATRFLEDRLGPDPTRWKWGTLHRLQFQHALGVNRVLDKIFNGPKVSIGGDTDTVFQTAVIPHQAFTPAWCPSWRQVVDLSCLERGRTILPTGQSGHPASPNYMDQFPLWLSGELRSHPSEYLKSLKLSPR